MSDVTKATESTHRVRQANIPAPRVLGNVQLVLVAALALSCGPRMSHQDPSLTSAQADTSWPVLIGRLADLDTTRVVQLDSGLVFRTDITLRFKAGISDSAKRAFFRRHSMTVVGVTQSGKFFGRIQDPGPTVENLWDALDALRSEPEVEVVAFISWTAMRAVGQADTTRPPVPTGLGGPAEILTLGIKGETIFRNVAEVRFDDTTSAVTVRSFLRRYSAKIVGGTPISRAYILEIPDPGATWEKYYAVISAMRKEPGVMWVRIASIKEMRVNLRFPRPVPHSSQDATMPSRTKAHRKNGPARAEPRVTLNQ